MAKKICMHWDELESKVGKKKAKYYCKKCDLTAPKEKWICKPKKL